MHKQDPRADGFIALLEDGYSMNDVAEMLGCSRETVRLVVRGAGYTKNAYAVRLMVSATSIMASLRDPSIKSVSALAHKSGASYNHTYTFLHEFGLVEVAARLFRARIHKRRSK